MNKTARRLLDAPYMIWAVIFIVVPLFIVAYYAFTDSAGAFTLANLRGLKEYREIFGVSLWYSVVATVICLVVSYPFAYFMSKRSANTQRTMMMLIMLPMWMNLLIRTYSWMNILERNGVINNLLSMCGLQPLHMIGTPLDIYNEPQNAFVADFIGESNILDGQMPRDYVVHFAGRDFPCLDKGFAPNEDVDVVIRPEDVDIVPLEKGMLEGEVTGVTFRGVHFEIIVDIHGFKWMIQTTEYSAEGDKVGLYIEPDAIHVMKKSKYSGLYGDFSSYSDEIDQLSELTEEEE